jgi:predicted DNA-binding transcriptional regulator YafY
MTALPQTQPSSQPLPLAVTLTTDQARAILNALEQLDDLVGLSLGQVKAKATLRAQVGGGR